MEKLTKAEEAALRELIAATHEDLVRGVPPAVIVPKCNQCSKMVGFQCSKYPNGIPMDILMNRQNCDEFQKK